MLVVGDMRRIPTTRVARGSAGEKVFLRSTSSGRRRLVPCRLFSMEIDVEPEEDGDELVLRCHTCTRRLEFGDGDMIWRQPSSLGGACKQRTIPCTDHCKQLSILLAPLGEVAPSGARSLPSNVDGSEKETKGK